MDPSADPLRHRQRPLVPVEAEYVRGCGRHGRHVSLGLVTDEKDTAVRGVGTVETKRQRRAPVAVLVLAVLAQGGVLLVTFALGLQWDGWTYLAAVVQALLLGVLVVVLTLQRRWLALAVPLISAALSVGFLAFFVKVEGAAACTQDMREATAQSTSPPGVKVSFNGEPGVGCVARFTVPASETDGVLAHYRRELTRHGWAITATEPDALVATRGRIVMNVSALAGEGGLVVMDVHHIS